jgi:hypothetical protein
LTIASRGDIIDNYAKDWLWQRLGKNVFSGEQTLTFLETCDILGNMGLKNMFASGGAECRGRKNRDKLNVAHFLQHDSSANERWRLADKFLYPPQKNITI